MISDTERREVARRLREYVDIPDDWWADTYSGWYVEKCVFGDVERHRESELFARLADLIEPSEPKVKCVAEVKVDGERLEKLAHDAAVELTGIDRDALLELADEMHEFGSLPAKHPGARVLHSEDFSRELGYARRIREACGEVGR